MGGYGSGRPAKRYTTADYHSIDIRRWQREGLLEADNLFNWTWRDNAGRTMFTALVRVSENGVGIQYRSSRGNVVDVLPFASTHCNFGGRRLWFLCLGCRRRAACLFFAGTAFQCRRCLGLSYESQRQDRGARLIEKARAIRRKMGGSLSLVEAFPSRPKGMHWTTYSRMKACAARAELAGLNLTMAKFTDSVTRPLERIANRA